MTESISTRTGRLSVDTNGEGIKFVSKFDGLTTQQTHTHILTVEQSHVMIHALARAIGGVSVEVQS
jgi:hypothetical protein